MQYICLYVCQSIMIDILYVVSIIKKFHNILCFNR